MPDDWLRYPPRRNGVLWSSVSHGWTKRRDFVLIAVGPYKMACVINKVSLSAKHA